MSATSQPRRRPTISLIVVTLLLLSWCWIITSFQGDTPWEPNDKGMVVGWIVYIVLIAAVLVYLWWRRVRAWVILATPAVSTSVTAWLISKSAFPEDDADLSDTSTFIDGLWPVLLYALVNAGIAALFGALVLHRSHRASDSSVYE